VRAKLDEINPESVAWYHYARSVTFLFLEVKQPGTISHDEWATTIIRNENPKLRASLENLWQEKRFDRRLL
jgi:hypothetical protein